MYEFLRLLNLVAFKYVIYNISYLSQTVISVIVTMPGSKTSIDQWRLNTLIFQLLCQNNVSNHLTTIGSTMGQ